MNRVIRTLCGAGLCLLLTGAVFSGSASATSRARPPADVTVVASRISNSSNPSIRWIKVAVATLWVTPHASRPIDQPSIGVPVHMREWLASMNVAQRSWLVGHLETQALFGTKVVVLATSGSWSHIVVTNQPTPRDPRGYPGWVPTAQLTAHAPPLRATYAVVTARTAWLHRTSDVSLTSNRVMELSFDTTVPVTASRSRVVEVALLDGSRGFLRSSDVAIHRSNSVSAVSGAAVLAVARKFEGLGYLWGGTSSFGYDCSGFTYSVFHSLGVTIARDAEPQSLHGIAVPRASLRTGDLVFFKSSSGTVVHVGIFLISSRGVASVLHAPATGMPIQVTALTAWPSREYGGARRYTTRA